MWLKSHRDYQFAFLDHEQALENALRSREIPIRGKERGYKRYNSEFARIELQLSNESRISVIGNRVEIGFTSFEDVEADANMTENWLLQNAIDTGYMLPNTSVLPPSRRAIENLKQYLSTRPDSPPQIKQEFFERLKAGTIPELSNQYGSLSRRAFERVWTETAPEPWTKGGFRPGRQRKTKTPR
jgi:hypothetical protein